MEVDFIFISMKKKKNVVRDYINLTNSDTLEQRANVSRVPPSSFSGRTAVRIIRREYDYSRILNKLESRQFVDIRYIGSCLM